MSGLNYGYSYTTRNSVRNRIVGVIYLKDINRWIVRAYKTGTKKVITIGVFDTQEDADEAFAKHISFTY